jgi:hypothetical protein
MKPCVTHWEASSGRRVIGYAAWRYNRLLAEAIEHEDWDAADAIAAQQLAMGRIGQTFAFPATVVVAVAALAVMSEGGAKVPSLPSGPSGFGYGSYL